MNTLIIVQARMGSTRLPGKILKLVMGRPMLELQIERLRRVRNVDKIVIATTTNSIDKPIIKLCKKLDCSYSLGSENDVLLRYYDAAKKFNADCIVRINADCPLIDSKVVEEIVKDYHLNYSKIDYISNILEQSYPIGLHTEVFSFKALEQACKEATDPLEREHVTPYIYRHPNKFKLKSVRLDADYSQYRWTVDYEEDFLLITRIYEDLYIGNRNFNMYDVVDYLKENPKLLQLNGNITKKQTL